MEQKMSINYLADCTLNLCLCFSWVWTRMPFCFMWESLRPSGRSRVDVIYSQETSPLLLVLVGKEGVQKLRGLFFFFFTPGKLRWDLCWDPENSRPAFPTPSPHSSLWISRDLLWCSKHRSVQGCHWPAWWGAEYRFGRLANPWALEDSVSSSEKLG